MFVNFEKKCPVTFVSTMPAQLRGQFWVAVHVAFADIQDVYEHVRRCRNHAKDPESEPLMTCTHPGAEAETRDGHHVVLFPLDQTTTTGHLSAVASFTFSCLSTCPSIKKDNKKRALKLSFRLETMR